MRFVSARDILNYLVCRVIVSSTDIRSAVSVAIRECTVAVGIFSFSNSNRAPRYLIHFHWVSLMPRLLIAAVTSGSRYSSFSSAWYTGLVPNLFPKIQVGQHLRVL